MTRTNKVQGRAGQRRNTSKMAPSRPPMKPMKHKKHRKYTKKQIYRNRRIFVGVVAVLFFIIVFSLVNVGVKAYKGISNRNKLKPEVQQVSITDDVVSNYNRFNSGFVPSKEIQFSSNYDTRVGKLYTITEIDEFNHLIRTSGKFREGSVFYTHPEAFLKAQEKTGVNALFMIAVCNIESNGGLAWEAIPKKSNNIFSIKTINGDWASYNSIDDAVMAFARLISEGSYYWKEDNFNVNSIGKIYCEEGHWTQYVSDTIQDCLEALAR